MTGILDCTQEEYERLQHVEQEFLSYLALTESMRTAQKKYFHNRDQTNLKAAKSLEKLVDQAIAAHQAPAADGPVQLTFTNTGDENAKQ